MSTFLLIFLSIYGGAHLYLGIRGGPLIWRAGRWWLAAWIIFLVLCLASPVVVRLVERAGHFNLARAMAWPTYVWMGAIFWFTCLMLPVDLWHLVFWGLSKLWKGFQFLRLPAPWPFVTVWAVVALMLVWGWVEAHSVRIVEQRFASLHMPPDAEPLRMLQFTDLHLGLIEREWRISNLARLVEQAEPDVIVSTGDLVDGSIDHIESLIPMLQEINAPLGKFAVTGNHEYYIGVSRSIAFHRESGFQMLRGEALQIVPGVVLAGVDDPTGRRRDPGYRDEDDLFRDNEALLTSPSTRILLNHPPSDSQRIRTSMDLMLSGHTHGGQIWPFGWLVKREFQYLKGRYATGDRLTVYTNPGTGTWGPPLRLGARPEVTLWIIYPAGAGEGSDS